MNTALRETTHDQRDRRGTGRALGWILAGTVVVHLPCLFNPFIIDDYVFVAQASEMSWQGAGEVLSNPTMDESASGVWWTPRGALPFYRPLAILSFAVDHKIWGSRPFGYHVTNLLLHLLCTCLVWNLAARLSSHRRLPTAAAVVFALHPVHSEAVMWISGRFDLLVCATVLGSTLAYLSAREKKGMLNASTMLCLALYVLALGCKETGLLLPGVLLGYELITRRRSESRPAAAAPVALFGGFGVIAIAYLFLRFRMFGGLGELPEPYGIDLTAPSALGRVLSGAAQYVLDFSLFVQVDALFLAQFWARHVLLMGLSVVVGLLILAAAYLYGRRCGPSLFALVWSAAFTAPGLMAMPGERNVYLASVGIALLFGSAWAGLMDRAERSELHRRRLRSVATVLIAIWVVVAAGEQLLMRRLANASQQVFDDLTAAAPDPPPDARIFVVNQFPIIGVGFNQAVRAAYGRSDVTGCVLTLSPDLKADTEDRVFRTGPSSIRIVRRNGVFFDSFLERFFLFSAPPEALSESAERFDLTLISPPDSFDGLTEIELLLPYPLDDPRTLLFRWDNSGVRTLTDVMWRAPAPRLVPCLPESPPPVAED